MESEDETDEEREENEMGENESDSTELDQSYCDKSVNQPVDEVVIQDNEKYEGIEKIFFHILPPVHGTACSKVLVYLPLNTPLFFKGKLKIVRVLSGSVECLGNVITSASISGYGHSIFSPKGYSLLRLLAIDETKENTNSDGPENRKLNQKLKNELRNLGLQKDVIRKLLRVDQRLGCFLELAELEGPRWVSTLEKYLPPSSSNLSLFGASRKGRQGSIALFGRDFTPAISQSARQPETLKDSIEKLLNVSFYDGRHYILNQKIPRLYKSHPDWDSAVQSIFKLLQQLVKNKSRNTTDHSNFEELQRESVRNPRLMVVGGKGVGKSTFMRYVTNRLLNGIASLDDPAKEPFPTILLIDLDPGQAEFTVPGCLSATKVSRPIMGPNFTHLDQNKVSNRSNGKC